VILGVGRGFRAATFDAFQVPRGEKRDRFEAALETMQRAWRGEPVASDGEASITLSPLPVQQPHPPVWVAAFGPKALAQAGRLGLPYLASPMESRGRLAENYAAHREACPDPSSYEDLVVPIMRTVFVTRSKEAEERVRTGLQAQIAALRGSRPLREDGVQVDDFALVGEPERVADDVARYREELGMTHLIARAHLPAASPEEVDASIALLAELCQRHGV
jgi:alkanesulfonate monooxygenase SsuD/methylene tetrahydromethanopterin reductase-like flavin-dependent oxidoreductase (luciferase family)